MDPQLHLASQTTYTCNTCGLAYPTSNDQKAHFRSEHHKFNLKRKCAGLPPITEKVFDESVAAETRAKEAEEKAFAASTPFFCSVCVKKFRSEAAFKEHVNSRKHRARSVQAGVDADSDDGEEEEQQDAASGEAAAPEGSVTPDAAAQGADPAEDDEEALIRKLLESRRRIEDEECPFCSWHADETLGGGDAAFAALMKHAQQTHTFFVPLEDRCIDARALVRCLQDKISLGLRCPWCPSRTMAWNSLEGLQAHMRDLGHCRILMETEDDAEEWADFYEGIEGDTGARVAENGMELLLASGRTAGHRALLQVYRQAVRAPLEYRPGHAARMAIQGVKDRLMITDGKERTSGGERDPRWERTIAEERRVALNHLRVGYVGNLHYNRPQTNV